MADRTPGGKEVDARTNRLAVRRLQLQHDRLACACAEAELSIEDLQDSIERKREQVAETRRAMDELRQVIETKKQEAEKLA